MSDLRSEIVSKVLNSWERPEAQPVKQSFGMQVFNYVKDHPYCTIAEVKEALDASDTQSTASTLKTLIDKGIIGREEKPVRAYQGFGRRTQYEYFAVSETYEAVNKGYWKAKGRPKGSKNAVKTVAIAESEELAPLLEKKLHKLEGFNPEMFVQELTLKDAKAVYEVLKGYFG
jgi:hypothetical protein